MQEVADELQYVAVVPVQETEAWLLLDESKIRRVAENPNGRSPLEIPRPSAIESIANPKEHLEEIILEASERSGRRREKIKTSLSQKKRQLIEGLDPESPIQEVPSWSKMFSDTQLLIDRLKNF